MRPEWPKPFQTGRVLTNLNTMETVKLDVSTYPGYLKTPRAFTLTFSDKEKKRIRRIYQMITEKLFDSAEYTYYAERVPDEDAEREADVASQWEADGCKLCISEYGISYSEYCKHDEGALIETETYNPAWLTATHEEETE